MQPSLFDLPQASPPELPPGLRYQPEVVTAGQERALRAEIERLPFAPFEFQGYLGHRRVVSFGWRYNFSRRRLERAAPIPDFLLSLRDDVARFTGHGPEAFEQALVLEYRPGAGIGWHRDRPQFGDVAGVSLLAPCPFRLRRRRGAGWDRATLQAAPRSAYLLSGAARSEWEHSIPPVTALRYSVTFRTMS
ncbi:alpha-ketoglutarate-dependent dioxygenase AlkB [Phenylobacterium sp. LjRoot164]|uniref:alpha-ketoglutarate-dependent dioxygenase AlkB n=1 Tax=unclassified Phenylobacterium TaxID=2640670 RepID=UPI003ECFDAE1